MSQYLFKRLTFLSLLSIAVFAQEVTMSWMEGLTINTNFGGWSGDYFSEYYIPPADGQANSIDFNMSDLPDVTGGSLSVAIYAANYPWDEINEEAIADAAPASWLGYYDNGGIFDIAGDNWIFGGINYLDGADSSFQYDPLGEPLWPETGTIDIPLYPNALDQDMLTLDLENSEFGSFYFVRNEAFIVVVKLAGFEDQSVNTEYRMGFQSAPFHHDPQPCLKFYNTLSSPIGRTGINDWGWHIRSYVWDWGVNVEFWGSPLPRFWVDQLQTTISTDDREVNATILADDPSGNVSLVEVRLHYTINDETFDVPMSGDDDLYTGVLPGQAPGTEVLYWVSAEFSNGDIHLSDPYSYSVFEPTEPILLFYDDETLDVGMAAYYYTVTLADTFFNNFDIWEAKLGPVSTELVNHYEIIYHIMGGGPFNDASSYSSVYAAWLAMGTADTPHRLFITGQDYGVISDFADTTFPASAFENMYLGVETLGPQDVSGFSPWTSIFDPYATNAVENDPLTGFLWDYAGDSLQLYHNPFTELGFGNWTDHLIPSTGTVCFTDPNYSHEALAVYNQGSGWKTAFWALDPLALSFYDPADTSSMYYWGLNVGGGPIAPTFDWFGPPHYNTVGIGEGVVVPATSKLHASHPNPFNPITNIAYELDGAADVNITVYNMLGREVAILVADFQPAGTYTVQWRGIDRSGHSVSSGLYFYTMQTEGFSATQKMMLLK